MDFVISLLILTNWKNNSYNSIFVIVNRVIKVVYYKPIKIIIDIPDLAEVIIVSQTWLLLTKNSFL